MWFNILFTVLVVYAIISPFFYAKAVRFGMKIAEKPEDAADMPFFNVPERKKKPEISEEEKRNAQILVNLNAYNGTSIGQRKIVKDNG